VLDQTAPSIIALAPTLAPEQLSHLARQFDKRNKKWRAEWLDASDAERSARHIKQRIDRAEMFYGPLQAPQLAVLRAHLPTTALETRMRHQEALRRQQDTLQTLRALQTGGSNSQQAEAAVHALLARTADSPDAAHRNHMTKIRQENCDALAALHNSSTSAQRRKLVETLKAYEADAQALMPSGR
jgi:hypothetical protein